MYSKDELLSKDVAELETFLTNRLKWKEVKIHWERNAAECAL